MRDEACNATGERTSSVDTASIPSPSLQDLLGMVREAIRNRDSDDGAPVARIGRFEVVRELGRGTFGVVLLARDPMLGCDRAVKVPTEAALDGATARSKFLREASLAAAIDHPNVVRVVEADDLGGFCYLVMEYCAEGSLAAWLKSRPKGEWIPERWAALLVAQIADGVHEAHERRIFHRDLKPGNILLARVGPSDGCDPPEFCPKVADFGLATLREEGAASSAGCAPVGTYAYMSPEQARGNRREIGAASDVYGLGAILFELLAGRRPYPMRDREELLGALLGEGPSPSLLEARPGVSRELGIIAQTALAKDSRNRYGSAAALADDLRRFVRGDPVRGAPLWKRARSFARSHRRLLAGAASLMLVTATVRAALEYQRAVQARSDGEATLWLDRVKAADVATLPELVKLHDTSDPRVAASLMALFDGGHPRHKLSAAVILSAVRPECAAFAYGRLLDAGVEEIGPFALALNRGLPDLAGRLTRDASMDPPTTTEFEAAARDRRANAATALVLIGRPDLGLRLLGVSRNPDARSVLIHTLGPAGVQPGVLLKALKEANDAPLRRSLLQALGEIPERSWASDPGARAAASAEAWRLYEDDPDPGVHGSAKWLVIRWGGRARLVAKDRAIRGGYRDPRRGRPGFGWRIAEEGLTMVLVGRDHLARQIEVSDCEVTVAQFTRFRTTHPVDEFVSPGPDGPANALCWNDAAAYCEWLNGRSGLPAAYLRELEGSFTAYYPDAATLDSPGFRLPTDVEFLAACRAGTNSRCYYGDSPSLAKHFAVCGLGDSPRIEVARLKPNDLGLFDTLGSLLEHTQGIAGFDRRNQDVLCGGWFLNPPETMRSDLRSNRPISNTQMTGTRGFGFRLARSIGP